MKEIAFVIPYFGKFNSYFQLFLDSCACNSECDWIIFTDDKRKFRYPNNVFVHYCKFTYIQQLVQSKFDYKISLTRPYKLCDFKPAYGYIFSEYLSDYKFWGHCDTDLIWGKINHFITQKKLENFDKIGILGHCTLYRNEKDISEMFMRPLNGKLRAKQVYSEECNHSFDEEFDDSINNIFEEYGLRIDYSENEANIYTKSSNFKITRLNIHNKTYVIEKKSRSFFVWREGILYRYIKRHTLEREEYLYIHMQSRPMDMKLPDLNMKIYKIIPNAFEILETDIEDLDNSLDEIKIKNLNLHYFKLRSSNLIKKIEKKLSK